MIDPGFWEDEHLGGCSREARLLFIGLWTFSDDWGHVSVNTKKLKGEVFRYDDDMDSENIHRALDELSMIDSIRLYVDGKHELAWIPRFLKYQRIDRPSRPQYELHPDQTDEDIAAIRRVFADYSSSIRDKSCLSKDKLSEVKRKEEKSTRKPRSASAPSSKTPDPNIKILIDHYHEEFLRLHPTVQPLIRGPADGRAIQDLLKGRPPEKLRGLMTRYLETSNDFYRAKGYPIWLFARDIVGIELGEDNGHRGSTSTTRSKTEAERKHEELKREFAGT